MDLSDVADPVMKYETMTRAAREAEDAGFDSIWLFDHFHTVPQPVLETTFECWTAMAGLARDTHRVQLGQMCTCNGYRPPALLAKISSCIDVMSHGRLIMGIGSGWYQHEFEAYGYEFGDAAERLRKLGEAVQVIRKMWTEERPVFHGSYYNISEPINEPKPVQRPHPPLWIAGGGEKVTLKLVAKYADGCNVGGSLEAIQHKLSVLQQHCLALGTDYARITKSTGFNPVLGSSREVDRIARDIARRKGTDLNEVKARFLTGSPEEIAEHMMKYVRLGIDYFIGDFDHAAEAGHIARVGQELLPLVREMSADVVVLSNGSDSPDFVRRDRASSS